MFFRCHLSFPGGGCALLEADSVRWMGRAPAAGPAEPARPPWGAEFRGGACFVCDRAVVFGNEGLRDDEFRVWQSTDLLRSWQSVYVEGIAWDGQFINFAHCADSARGSIFVMGGADADGERLSHVWRSDTAGGTWWPVQSRGAWSARSSASAVCLADGTVLLMGGEGERQLHADVWEARTREEGSLFHQRWTKVCDSAPWGPRFLAGCVANSAGDAVFLIGGVDRHRVLNDVWISRDRCRTWALACACAPWSPRVAFGASIGPKQRIVLTGGCLVDGVRCAFRRLDDEWAAAADGGLWMRLPTTELHWAAAAPGADARGALRALQSGHSVLATDASGKTAAQVAATGAAREVLETCAAFPFHHAESFVEKLRACVQQRPDIARAAAAQAAAIPTATAAAMLAARRVPEAADPRELLRVALKRGSSDTAARLCARMVRTRTEAYIGGDAPGRRWAHAAAPAVEAGILAVADAPAPRADEAQ
jgi:hypothetical protein